MKDTLSWEEQTVNTTQEYELWCFFVMSVMSKIKKEEGKENGSHSSEGPLELKPRVGSVLVCPKNSKEDRRFVLSKSGEVREVR